MGEPVGTPHFLLFTRAIIGLILLAAGTAKLLDRRKFVEIVRAYQLLPNGAAALVGVLLPFAEVFVAANLVLGFFMPWPALVAGSLFLFFASAVAINLLRGRRNIECGCFGSQQGHLITWTIVLRNAALAGGALAITSGQPTLFVRLGSFSLGSDTTQRLSVEETVATILVAAGAISAWWLWNVLLTVLRLPGSGHLVSPSRER